MSKKAANPSDMNDSLDIPENIRKAIIQGLEEWDSKYPRRGGMETAALLSADEAEQLNAAMDTVADKLGFSGELAKIDSFLQLRSTRVARIISAACRSEGFTPETA